MDPLPRLGRHLGRLGRRGQRRDHVELAPARDLGAARDVRPNAARSAAAPAPARPPERRTDRPAAAARRARRGSRRAGRRRPPRPVGAAPRAPRARPRRPAPRATTAGTSTEHLPGRTRLVAISRSTSAATAAPARARWRSARTEPRPRRPRLGIARAPAPTRPPGAPAPGTRKLCVSVTTDVRARVSAKLPRHGRRRRSVGRPPSSAHQLARRGLELLRVVEQHVLEPRATTGARGPSQSVARSRSPASGPRPRPASARGTGTPRRTRSRRASPGPLRSEPGGPRGVVLGPDQLRL